MSDPSPLPVRESASAGHSNPPSTRDWRALAVVALFGLGGVPALIEQVVWQRILTLHSGVGAISVSIIVSAFMAGLGLGSWLGGQLSRRLTARGALIAFSTVELALGVFAWWSGPFYYAPPHWVQAWFQDATWKVSVAHFLLLLPPTTLMGMTFPLLTRGLVRESNEAARVVGRLYAVNLAGAALGAFAAPWFLIPFLGLTGALRLGAVCHVIGAVGVVGVGWRLPNPTEEREVTAVRGTRQDVPLAFWGALSFASGFLGISLEILWFRVIDVGVKSTSFTFGTVLSVYLIGLAAGTWLGTDRASRWRDPVSVFLACQCGVLGYVGISMIVIAYLPPWVWGYAWLFDYWGTYEPITPGWASLGATIGLSLLFPVVLFGVPTSLMGIAFAALQKGIQKDAPSSGYKVGLLQAVNIAGCVLGGLVVGLRGLATPGTAPMFAILVLTGLIFACGGAVRATQFRGSMRPWHLAAASLAVLVALMPGQDRLWLRIHGQNRLGALVAEDVAGVSALILQSDGRWRMSTNGKGQSLLPFGGVHSKLGALPATLHSQPERIAIIGLGSGDTAWAASCRPETRKITVFETCANQLNLLRELSRRQSFLELRRFLSDPRIEVVEADGRMAIARSPRSYDLIEADAVRPDGASAGNLYSVEFFRLCAQALRPGGLMCTWSPTQRTRASFCRAFPHVVELDNGVILVGSNEPIVLDMGTWRAALDRRLVASYLGPGPLAECQGGMMSARSVDRRGLAGMEVNTDLDPRDEYHAP